jgi:ABC-type multidrug transport system permease subunit
MNYTQAEPERVNELEFKCKWIEPLLSSLQYVTAEVISVSSLLCLCHIYMYMYAHFIQYKNFPFILACINWTKQCFQYDIFIPAYNIL